MYIFNPTNALYFYPHRLRFEPTKESAERRPQRRWPSPSSTTSPGRRDHEDRWEGESVADVSAERDEH